MMPLHPSARTVMIEFNAASKPTLDQVKEKFSLQDTDIDTEAGVTEMKSSGKRGAQTYIAIVTSEAANKIEKSKHPDFIQQYSNPQFEPFKPL